MVAEGDGKSWHRARVLCHRQRGELVKVHDASFMLALIQFLRVKGLTASSFWAGGLRTGAKKWSWVDGTSVDLKEPHWYLSPVGLPEDVPLSRKGGEEAAPKEAPARKRSRRPAVLNLGERPPPGRAGAAKGPRPKTRAGPSSRRRRRRPKDSQRRRAREFVRSGDGAAPVGASDVTVVDDVFVGDDVASFEEEYWDGEVNGTDGVDYDIIPDEYLDYEASLTDDADDGIYWTDDVNYDNHVTLTDGIEDDYDVTHPNEPISTWNDGVTHSNGPISTRDDGVTHPDGPISARDDGVTHPNGPISARDSPSEAPSDRDQRGASVLLSGPRASSNPVMALSHQRAACMWADLGHFLASCSVLHNLIAICEYTPQEI
ncbi:uncharacterized protein LOC119593045 [Penaeus monodon]|uniref:uncharacterized protein LOC119593045 n=1 Tax=Penaeus monodon TaxID=6687 RepID=UPI0018A7C608|nr:uncharacterized protein LOC119593045 [Penaeus monodon]